LIILWESTSTHLHAAFPEAKILHLMPGFLGRLPYPELVYFDTHGLFKNSRLYLDAQAISTGSADARSLSAISEIRRLCVPFFEKMNRIADIIDNLSAEKGFTSLSLLPMQFSRHYNFRVDTAYQSQSEFLLDVLAKTPPDTGVLVTKYIAGDIFDDCLNQDFLSGLHKKFNNFLYDPEFDKLDNVSQFILPFVDSVVTCSSSLGLQGLLYKKKVRVVQDTFLSRIVAAAQQSEDCRERVLARLVGQSNVQWKRLLEPKFLMAFLEAVADGQVSRADFDLHAIDGDYGAKLLKDFRFDRTLQKSGHFLRVAKKEDDYISPSVIASLEKTKIASFDIFDTLIERPLAQPSDVFLALEHQWKIDNPNRYLELSRARIEAEALAKASLSEGKEEVCLGEIYESLKLILNISEEESRKIMELEMRLEENLLTSRPVGKRLYELAKSLGKKIIYASDMYLSAEFICSVLEKNGYDESNALYLSSRLDLKKKSGTMFSYILEKEGVAPGDIVHFGDNPQGDEMVPKSYGIKAYRLARAVDRMRGHEKYKNRFKLGGHGNRSLHESALAFLVARRLFDNPFLPPDPDAYFNNSAVNLGYCGLGPCVTDFALWLGSRVKMNDNDGVFFVARDGRIVMKAYQALFPERDHAAAYIFGSRRLLRSSFKPSAAELYAALGNLKSQRPSSLLKNWYGWETENPVLQETVNDEEGLTAARHALLLELPKIGERNSANAELLRDYARHTGLLLSKKPAIVEIGYAGTIQEGFYKALNIPMHGYYFVLFNSAHARISGNLPMEGYVGHLIDRMYHWHGICQNGFLYETLFCSDESTILGLRKVEDKIHAIRENNDYDAARRSFIRKVHRGAANYAADMYFLLNPILHLINPDPFLGSRILDDFVNSPSGKDAALFEGVIFSNNFSDGSYRYVVPPRHLLEEVWSGRIKTVWPKGTSAFKTDLQKSATAAEKKTKDSAAVSNINNSRPNTAPTLKKKMVSSETASMAEEFQRKFNQEGNPNFLRHAAEEYIKTGEREKAITLLKKARKLLPGNKNLRRRLFVVQYPFLRVILGKAEFSEQK